MYIKSYENSSLIIDHDTFMNGIECKNKFINILILNFKEGIAIGKIKNILIKNSVFYNTG